VDRKKERAAVLNALGVIESARGRAAKAEAWYRESLMNDQTSISTRHNLALLLSAKGRSPEAEDLWKENLADFPDDIPSLLALGDYLARDGQENRSIALYQHVLKLRHEYGGARRKLASVYLAQGKPELALSELRAVVKEQDNAEVLEQIGDLEARSGDESSARKDWTRAAKASSDRAAVKRIEKKIARGGA
jgi:tetratricopeptide (TPR) repeat protein